jgi:N-glycosylase/DNA lyase
MDKKPSEYISEFLNFVAEAQVQYRLCSEEEDRQEKLTQDYLHSLELDDLKCNERSKIATKLAINRKDRRYFKDRVEEFEPIVKFFEEQQNKKMLDKLKEVLGQVRKQENYHKYRTYIPKVLKEKKDE